MSAEKKQRKNLTLDADTISRAALFGGGNVSEGIRRAVAMFTDGEARKYNVADRARGAFVGLAAGDAVGTTNEFKARGSFAPITDMVGGGVFKLKAGEWTDDTSMALCLAASLIEMRMLNLHDQIKRYKKWADTGYMSHNGRCFDIGSTVSAALRRYEAGSSPAAGSTDPKTAGNGSLMRLSPVAILQYRNPRAAAIWAREQSITTHGAPEAVHACGLLGALIAHAINGESKDRLLSLAAADGITNGTPSSIRQIAGGDFLDMTRAQIRGTGYAVDSLRAALWCVFRHDNYRAIVLEAANLGDDADTTAAIAGQLAGAIYGESGIPAKWLRKLAWGSKISEMADQLQAVMATR